MTPLETVVYLVFVVTGNVRSLHGNNAKEKACSYAAQGTVWKVTSYPEVCVAKESGYYCPNGECRTIFFSPSVCTRKEPTVESVDCGEGK